jgi:hypothetical protein
MAQNVKINNKVNSMAPQYSNRDEAFELPNRMSIQTKTVLSTNDISPMEFMTDEEFWEKANERIDNICRKYGLL